MAAKKLIREIPSISHNKNNPTKFKMAATKTKPKYDCYLKSQISPLV